MIKTGITIAIKLYDYYSKSQSGSGQIDFKPIIAEIIDKIDDLLQLQHLAKLRANTNHLMNLLEEYNHNADASILIKLRNDGTYSLAKEGKSIEEFNLFVTLIMIRAIVLVERMKIGFNDGANLLRMFEQASKHCDVMEKRERSKFKNLNIKVVNGLPDNPHQWFEGTYLYDGKVQRKIISHTSADSVKISYTRKIDEHVKPITEFRSLISQGIIK